MEYWLKWINNDKKLAVFSYGDKYQKLISAKMMLLT